MSIIFFLQTNKNRYRMLSGAFFFLHFTNELTTEMHLFIGFGFWFSVNWTIYLLQNIDKRFCACGRARAYSQFSLYNHWKYYINKFACRQLTSSFWVDEKRSIEKPVYWSTPDWRWKSILLCDVMWKARVWMKIGNRCCFLCFCIYLDVDCFVVVFLSLNILFYYLISMFFF